MAISAVNSRCFSNPHDLHVTVRSPGAGGFLQRASSVLCTKNRRFWRKLPKQNQDESQQIFR
jgi:hypothetical protein